MTHADMIYGPGEGAANTPPDHFTSPLLRRDDMPHEGTARKRSRQSGPLNPNWRGGRSVASNGYVLIRVGIGHPMADVRGYAYEHRLVASHVLGRPLARGELVHHRNGDKTDNRPENLEVVRGNAGHLLHHRKHLSWRRLPGEGNPVILCACGCGAAFTKFDPGGPPCPP